MELWDIVPVEPLPDNQSDPQGGGVVGFALVEALPSGEK